MLSVRSIVRRRVGEQQPVATVTASDLLARPEADRSGPGPVPGPVPDDELIIPEGMLTDLHHPRLVITEEYVGPDRRTLDRSQRRTHRRDEQRRREWHPGSEFPSARSNRVGRPSGTLVLATAVATAAAVAPLTLVVAHLAAH